MKDLNRSNAKSVQMVHRWAEFSNRGPTVITMYPMNTHLVPTVPFGQFTFCKFDGCCWFWCPPHRPFPLQSKEAPTHCPRHTERRQGGFLCPHKPLGMHRKYLNIYVKPLTTLISEMSLLILCVAFELKDLCFSSSSCFSENLFLLLSLSGNKMSLKRE